MTLVVIQVGYIDSKHLTFLKIENQKKQTCIL
jgi:hypothetical protein